MGGYPKTITFLNIPEILLAAKCNAHLIKKISQSKSDIPSCQCKNGGGGGVCTQARISVSNKH